MTYKIHVANLSFLTQITIVDSTLASSVVSAVYGVYVHASHKLRFPAKDSSTRENIYLLAAAEEATFSNTADKDSETI